MEDETMRSPDPKSILAMALLATSWMATTPALADDSDGEGTERMVPGIVGNMPGMQATGPSMQRPATENPDMKPFLSATPATAAPTTDVAPAPTPAIAAEAPAGSAPVAALQDVDQLLRRVEAELAKHRVRTAATDLEQAETALLNARAAGLTLPTQAIDPVIEAQAALRRGDRAAAARATETAEHAVAASG
jgi:hypothetical protein